MKKLLGRAFVLGLQINAALTRSQRLVVLEQRCLTPFFVWVTRLVRGAPREMPKEGDASALGKEWERLLGAGPYAQVTHVDLESGTAYGEIRGRCPLRGTGDLEACQRLMAYDRRLLAPYGARFVVLRSQAEKGRTRCEVAIRNANRPHEDLIPAHRLQRS